MNRPAKLMKKTSIWFAEARSKYLVGLVFLLFYSLLSQAAPEIPIGRAKGGFMVPDYDAANRLRSVLSGESAEAISVTLWRVNKLKIELRDEQERPAWIVEAPECVYDYTSKSARSATQLTLRSADGQMSISGSGFEWKQADQHLVISNEVRTVLRKSDKKEPGEMASLNRQNLEVTADHFEFNSRQYQAVYRGNVAARELSPVGGAEAGLKITCGMLTVKLPANGKGPVEHILGEQNLVVQQGNNRVTGDRANYVVTNDFMEVTGKAEWATDQARGRGEILVLDRKANRFQARGNTFTRLIPAGDQSGSLAWFGPQTTNTGQPLEIEAASLTASFTEKTNVNILAETDVKIRQGENHAAADKLTYNVTGTNVLVELDRHAVWQTPEAESTAAYMRFDRGRAFYQAQGGTTLKIKRASAPTAKNRNAQVAAQSLEVSAERYQYQAGEFKFEKQVKVTNPLWRVTCEEVRLVTMGNASQLQSVHARQNVVAESLGESGAMGLWQLRCQQMQAVTDPKTGGLESFQADQGVTINQISTPNHAAPVWKMDSQRLSVRMVPGGQQQIQSVLAEENVQISQSSSLATQGMWWLTSGKARMDLAATNSIEKIVAEDNVHISQGSLQSTQFVWRLTGGKARMDMAPSNRIEKIEVENNVRLVQGSEGLKKIPIHVQCDQVVASLNASNQIQTVHARRQVRLEQGESYSTSEEAFFNAANNEVELRGKPFLRYVEASSTTGKPPQSIQVERAEVLVWNRVSNRFRAKGPYLLKPIGNLDFKTKAIP